MTRFDSRAKNYHAGFDDPVKRLLGRDSKAFLRPKISRIIRLTNRTFSHAASSQLSLLDFGCGSGDLLVTLAEEGVPWRLEGCDVSEGMLTEARRRHAGRLDRIALWNPNTTSARIAEYHVVTAVCVFHHIPSYEWMLTTKKIFTSLRPGGLFVLVEHNPNNPVTNWMIKRTELDVDAVLLSPKTSRQILTDSGFEIVDVEFFLFFPPRIRWLSSLESMFQRIPFGGQYLIGAQKSRSSS
jgi:2-polyprenyl-3-methyl-5-hydroxy-6-metoxy-1,4-benzoquinol methylase